MTGHDKETVKSIVAALAINVSLALVLVPLYGLNGAAVSSAMSLAARNLILTRLTYKCTGLRTFAFSVHGKEKK
jgi:O-antigen/teichoic acid export membrane protein